MNIRGLQDIYESYFNKPNNLLLEATPPSEDVPLPPKDSMTPEEAKAEKELVDSLEYKIVGGKHKLYAKAPELGRILSKMTIKIVNSNDPHVQTMAVDNFGNIYINPKFSDKLSDDEFYGVFAHEALHIANRTFLRKGSRDHTLWNIATDAIMNWYLTRDNFVLPKMGILPDPNSGKFELEPLPGMKKEFTVLDDKNEALNAEGIYEQLVEFKDELSKGLPENGEGEGEGEGGDGEGKAGGKAGGKGNKKGKGPGGSNIEITPDGKVLINGKPMTKADLDKALEELDNKIDTHLTNEQAREVNKDLSEELTPDAQKQLEKEMIDDLKRATADSSRTFGGGGKDKGAVRQLVQRSIPPDPVNWKGIITSYLQQGNSRSYDWNKLSRRSMASGVPMPGRGTAPTKLSAVFALDTSGSVGDAQLFVACEYIRKAAKAATHLDVHILLWHHQAYFLSKPIADKGALEATLKNIKKQVKAGGNAISDVDRMIKAAKLNPIVTIYITDGQEEAPEAAKLKEGKYKKLFIIVSSYLDERMITLINKQFGPHGRVVYTPNLD
jgi:predicted metal-dependent peptidase